MSKRFDLSGKVALITGGSRGLGLAIARAYAEHGADLVIASRKLDACASVAESLRRDFKVRALPVAFHAGRWDDCERLIGAAMNEYGRLDILVSNAGASPLYPSLPAISEELWDKVLGLNLKGPFRLSVLAAEQMVKSGGGSIINVSSVAAVQPTSIELPYAIAKAGLHNMTAGLAHAYGGKVRFNVIMPGAFLTDISKAWPAEVHEHIKSAVPMGRGGKPEEIVGAALYLASDDASYTSGAVIKVDGGWAYQPG
ncbi:MAG: SDR family oxidoreductase [Nevskia sp.]|nr:SDR family oxidoreductase [Nevskia sp.]